MLEFLVINLLFKTRKIIIIEKVLRQPQSDPEDFCLFDLGLTSLSTSFSHIATVSGCGRELNAHFQSAASLKYHVPDTLT